MFSTLVYGPAGCGKKMFVLEKIKKEHKYDDYDYDFQTHVIDCMEMEETMNRTKWLDEIDYYANNIDTRFLCIWNIDQVPILWQRGLLCKLEDWASSSSSLQFFCTARSLSKVDTALKSRLVLVRKESRFKEELSSSLHLTDYDFHFNIVESSTRERDKMFFHLDTLWKNFLDGKPDTDLYLKDLFKWGMTIQEMVFTLLDVFSSTPFAYSIDQMSEIISLASKIPLKTGNWIHMMDWLISVRKIVL